jgi:hypothetical protein
MPQGKRLGKRRQTIRACMNSAAAQQHAILAAVLVLVLVLELVLLLELLQAMHNYNIREHLWLCTSGAIGRRRRGDAETYARRRMCSLISLVVPGYMNLATYIVVWGAWQMKTHSSTQRQRQQRPRQRQRRAVPGEAAKDGEHWLVAGIAEGKHGEQSDCAWSAAAVGWLSLCAPVCDRPMCAKMADNLHTDRVPAASAGRLTRLARPWEPIDRRRLLGRFSPLGRETAMAWVGTYRGSRGLW